MLKKFSKAHSHETGACVQKHSNENSDVPVDNEQQLYCTVQQCQMDGLHFCSYARVVDSLV